MVAIAGVQCKCGINKEGQCVVTGPGEDLPEGAQDISRNTRNVQIDIPADGVVVAKVEMYFHLKRIDVHGRYQIFVEDPFAKKEKEVAEIRFKDGTVLNMELKGCSKDDE